VAAAVILDPEADPRRPERFQAAVGPETRGAVRADPGHGHRLHRIVQFRRIDETDIRKASLDAMRRAICGLSILPSYVLTDGLDVPPGLHCPGQAVVKGDARSVSIAAASIVAKVTRDRMMTRADLIFPGLRLCRPCRLRHAAASRRHRQHGPCPLHRMSFRPLRPVKGSTPCFLGLIFLAAAAAASVPR
jgi:ribonuclease HII